MAASSCHSLTAKCHAMLGRLLTDDDYNKLLTLGSLRDIASYLSGHAVYAEYFSDTSAARMPRRRLEQSVRRALISDYLKLYTFLTGDEKKYIALSMSKFELETLLGIWRSINHRDAGNAESYSAETMAVFTDNINIFKHYYENTNLVDIALLAAALENADRDMFAEAIAESKYAHIFENHMNSEVADDFTQLEVFLYNRYYLDLYSSAAKFSGVTCESLEYVVQVQADLTNLSRISRMIHNFNAPAERVIPMLMPLRGRIRDEDMQILMTLTDKKDFYDRLEETYYGKKQSFYGYVTFSEYLTQYLYRYYRSRIWRNDTGFFIAICYLYLKNVEINNIIYLVEGIRYNMPPDQIRAKIISSGTAEERR